jgi:hypothetical protein
MRTSISRANQRPAFASKYIINKGEQEPAETCCSGPERQISDSIAFFADYEWRKSDRQEYCKSPCDSFGWNPGERANQSQFSDAVQDHHAAKYYCF